MCKTISLGERAETIGKATIEAHKDDCETHELLKSFKSQTMTNKTVISNFNAIEENDTLTYDTRSISKIVKISFQTQETLF